MAEPDRSSPNNSIQQLEQTDHASSAEPNTSTQLPTVKVAKQYSFPAPCCSFMGMAQTTALPPRSVSSPSLNQLMNQQYYSIGQTLQPSMEQVVQPNPSSAYLQGSNLLPNHSFYIKVDPNSSATPPLIYSPTTPTIIHYCSNPNIGPSSGDPNNNMNQLPRDPEPEPSALQPNQKNTTPDQAVISQITQTDQTGSGGTKCSNKKSALANKAGNLANLLPTGTVLAFQALIPSLSNDGKCGLYNRYLVSLVISFCGLSCFLSTFTDSFKIGNNVYYGFATRKGLYLFNNDENNEEKKKVEEQAKKHHIKSEDFVHAFGSLFVFLVFAICSADVLDCYFPQETDENKYSMIIYLPLVAGVMSSFLFSICPTKRKGVGIADDDDRPK